VPAEASAWARYDAKDWENALLFADRWHDSEPFLAQPFMLMTHIASTCLLDHQKAKSIAALGLRANPTNFTIVNNFAYAACHIGAVREAEIQLNLLDPERLSEREKTVLQATRGLLAYRQGRPEAGRELYLGAIADADSLREPVVAASAQLNYAWEQSRIGVSTETRALCERAIAQAAETKYAPLEPLATRLVARLLLGIDILGEHSK